MLCCTREKFLRVINYLCFVPVVLAQFTQTNIPNNKEQEFMLNYSKLQRSSFASLFACLSVCLKLSISQFKNNRAFSSGSGNLAEGSSTGREHGNLSSITEYFHWHRSPMRQDLQKFKPRISKVNQKHSIFSYLEMCFGIEKLNNWTTPAIPIYTR